MTADTAHDLADRHRDDAPRTPADELVRQLYSLSALRRHLGRSAAGELGGVGFVALGAVWRLGPSRVSDIACELHIDLSVASRQIAALTRDGLLDRTTDPDDRRAHVVSLTPAGVEALRRTHDRMVGHLEHALTDWTDAEVSDLSGAIARLIAGFDPEQAATQSAPYLTSPRTPDVGAAASAATPGAETTKEPLDGQD